MWFPILKGIATLHEMKTIYYLEDILDMNEALELESYIIEKAKESEEEIEVITI